MQSVEILQNKDGVLTRRIRTGGFSCIEKRYEDAENAREIQNYRILNGIEVPTLQVLGFTDRSLVLEDIALSPKWRLGRGGDLSDPKTAAAIARWYRLLHERGKAVAKEGLYDESDLFTMEHIRRLPEQTDTVGCAAWSMLERHFGEIRCRLDRLTRTLTYHDFYWTNLAVSGDGEEALMFDYNMMGQGYAYADVRNVTVSMDRKAAQAFLSAYGPTDPEEQAVDDVVSVIVTLVLAARRTPFPSWAEESRRILRTELPERIERLLTN